MHLQDEACSTTSKETPDHFSASPIIADFGKGLPAKKDSSTLSCFDCSAYPCDFIFLTLASDHS